MVSTGNSIMHIYEALLLYLSKEYKSCDLSRIQFPCDKKLLIIYVNIENHSFLVVTIAIHIMLVLGVLGLLHKNNTQLLYHRMLLYRIISTTLPVILMQQQCRKSLMK